VRFRDTLGAEDRSGVELCQVLLGQFGEDFMDVVAACIARLDGHL
jgi:hypothetical protein